MGCKKKFFRFKIKDNRLLGILLVAIGTTIIFVIVLPYTVWIVLVGIILIMVGYKLFLC